MQYNIFWWLKWHLLCLLVLNMFLTLKFVTCIWKLMDFTLKLPPQHCLGPSKCRCLLKVIIHVFVKKSWSSWQALTTGLGKQHEQRLIRALEKMSAIRLKLSQTQIFWTSFKYLDQPLLRKWSLIWKFIYRNSQWGLHTGSYIYFFLTAASNTDFICHYLYTDVQYN